MMIVDVSVNLLFVRPVAPQYRAADPVGSLHRSVAVSANSVSKLSYVSLPADSSTFAVYAPAVDEFSSHFRKIADILSDPSLCPEDAERPNDIASKWARIVLQKFREYALPPSRVVATAEGGIAICIVSGSKYADIECLNSGEILAVTSSRSGPPYVWEINNAPNDIEVSVSRIRKFISLEESSR